MLLKINPYEIIHQIFVSNFGLEKYSHIIKHVNQVNIAENREFQKRFNGFYRVRRDEAWQEQFYGFFETAKVQNPSFDEIIEELYHRTGRIEASFSSKMLANIDDSKPIWDSFVLNALDFKNPLPSMPKLEQMKRKIEIYHKIDRWYMDYLKTENAQECIAKFNEKMCIRDRQRCRQGGHRSKKEKESRETPRGLYARAGCGISAEGSLSQALSLRAIVFKTCRQGRFFCRK